MRDTNIAVTKDAALLSGAYYSHRINADIVAEAYGFYDKSRLTSAYGGVTAANYDLIYFGERVAGKVGIFAFEEECIYQGGEARVGGIDKTNAAFQLAARAGVVMGNNKANLGLDILSGDDDLIDDDVKTYRADYYFMPAAAPSGMDDPYGSEIDIEAHIAWFPKSNIVLGAGFFFPGDNGFLLGAAGLPNAAASKETGILLYCMPVFNF